ncbi:MAG: SRPBCC domain-containing protein [Inquilinus sp.]|nr:SRPBCC domain-containing protein [Inquilinus sp.]
MSGQTGAVRREMFIEAAPATIFAFFTDPEKMARWMGVSHQLDPRPGGLFLVDVHHGNVARGEFKEVTPNSRVVFSWGWDGEGSTVPPGSSQVAIDLTPRDSGTLLVLTHSGLPEKSVAPHTEGWNHYIGRLAIAAGGGDAGPDPWAAANPPE